MSNIVPLDRDRVLGKKVYVFCEGSQTEYNYFTQFNISNQEVEVIKGKGKMRMDIVDDATGKFNSLPVDERNNCKSKWIVMDYDRKSDFKEAIKVAKDNGFKVAYSNMCFEYWILLHFLDDENGAFAVPSNSDSCSEPVIREINDKIDEYNKKHPKDKCNSKYDKGVSEVLFKFLCDNQVNGERRIMKAFRQSMSIDRNKRSNYMKESITNMYELLLDIGVVRERHYVGLYTLKGQFRTVMVRKVNGDKNWFYYDNNDYVSVLDREVRTETLFHNGTNWYYEDEDSIDIEVGDEFVNFEYVYYK